VPFLGSAVLATTALLGCKPSDEVRALLDALGSGEKIATLAISLATAPGSIVPDAIRADSGLTGRVRSVADAQPADVLLVPAQGGGGLELCAVPVAQQGVEVTPVTSLDLTRPIADVTLDGATGTLLAGPESAESAVDGALWTAAGLLASEQLGIAEWCFTTTVAYLKDRHQFGRPVGSFQALKHRLADIWGDLVLARAAARNAADDPGQLSASVAQALCSTVAVHAAEECVQLHGGIGMTWEHDLHFLLKRAKVGDLLFGTGATHRAQVAHLLGLAGAA